MPELPVIYKLMGRLRRILLFTPMLIVFITIQRHRPGVRRGLHPGDLRPD